MVINNTLHFLTQCGSKTCLDVDGVDNMVQPTWMMRLNSSKDISTLEMFGKQNPLKI